MHLRSGEFLVKQRVSGTQECDFASAESRILIFMRAYEQFKCFYTELRLTYKEKKKPYTLHAEHPYRSCMSNSTLTSKYVSSQENCQCLGLIEFTFHPLYS